MCYKTNCDRKHKPKITKQKQHIYRRQQKKDQCGIGIYIQKGHQNWYYSFKAKNNACITSIELCGLGQAMKIAKELNMTNPTIFTDSLTSCDILKEAEHETQIDENIYNILNLSKEINAEIWWIPVHVGINGNECADRLAKEGTITDNIIDNKICYTDVYEELKKNMTKETKEWYEKECSAKGKKFQEFQKEFEMIPWEKDININPEEYTGWHRRSDTLCKFN